MSENNGETSEVERIFKLIDRLKSNKSVTFAGSHVDRTIWRVSFKGEPSFRHVNRIGMFRDYLGSLLPGSLETVGGERGSVVVLFATRDSIADGFAQTSGSPILEKSDFVEIAGLLGVSSLEFGDSKLEF